ncbi:PA2169 family four-helix-bundle protein [Olivibacter ginsenosidimutans]|uniref:PA2169 family four-helix-bundle protein n=1 Tax=Olivibacter ginsenosidimutans TaxID=1176537 RepID=A0ABP9B175_9SPHI
MSNNENSITILNDLIQINNDRVAGFEKALADIKDENVDLKVLFQEFTAQSRKFSQELTTLVTAHAGHPETGTSMAGELHRAWIDVKALFGGGDRKSILEEAERGEDAIKKAYNDALKSNTLAPDTIQLVSKQADEIKSAHDKIKALRDAS